MISCTLMDIQHETNLPNDSTLVDVTVGLVAQFESTIDGEVMIDQQRGIAAAAEGHVFNSLTESSIVCEVLQRYLENGIEGLLTMTGQYTVIVYDSHQNKLIGLTDTLSKRSLFYEKPDCSRNRFSISNTLSWLKKTKEISKLDLTYMVAFLGGRPKPAGRTPYKDVRRIPLATHLTYEARKRKVKLREYWWPFPQTTLLPINICAHRLNEVMTEVICEYIDYYKDSIGVMLSGGLDSSYVYAVAANVGNNPRLLFIFRLIFQIVTNWNGHKQ